MAVSHVTCFSQTCVGGRSWLKSSDCSLIFSYLGTVVRPFRELDSVVYLTHHSWSRTGSCKKPPLFCFSWRMTMGMLICFFCAAASFMPFNDRRKHAIMELLGRFAPRLTEYDIAGLQGSLRIPRSWIDEAKVSFVFHRRIV